jgi:predicted methyltransferase
MNSPSLAYQLSHARRLVHAREGIQRALQQNGPLCLQHVVILSDIDYRTVLFILAALEREGRVEVRGSLIFGGDRALVKHGSGGSCAACDESRELRSDSISSLQLPIEIMAMRVAPSLFYGQRGVTRETLLRRCEYMIRRGDVDNRRIVFLGDNDYQSVALASIAKPNRVVVLDIDVRILSSINRAARENDLSIETYHHDLFEPLRPELRNAFDVFVFDPYPTPDATFEAMAVANGINLLETSACGVGYTFALPTHKFKGNALPFQRMLTDFGLVVTDVVPRLAEFLPIPGELIEDEEQWIARLGGFDGVVSHTKSLVRFETTQATATPPPKDGRPYVTVSAHRREQLVRGMSTHYLLHAVGFEDQKRLVIETASDHEEWQEAFAAAERNCSGDTMPVDRLLREIVGSPLSEADVGRLLADTTAATLRQLAAENGYTVRKSEAQVLRTIATAGYEGLVAAGLSDNPEYRLLYLAARVFASHFRDA